MVSESQSKKTYRKLSDKDVIALRQEAAADVTFNYKDAAARYDSSIHTLSKAVRGDTFPHLDEIAPPVRRQTAVLNDEAVIQLRHLAHEQNGIDLTPYAAQYGISKYTLQKAVNGHHYSRLNAVAPPFDTGSVPKNGNHTKARTLYQGGTPLSQIAKILKVSQSSVALWCHDLIDNTTAKSPEERARKRAQKAERIKTNIARTTLSLENVVAIRKAIRETGRMDIEKYAETYGYSVRCVRRAVIGETHQEANLFEAPIKGRKRPRHRANLLQEKAEFEELIAQAIYLRRADPKTWTYASLATWLSDRTGKKYRSGPVAILFINRDPTLKELEEEKPKRISYSCVCEICDEPFKSYSAGADLCRKTECRDIVKSYT